MLYSYALSVVDGVSGSKQHYKRKTTVQLSLIDLFGMLYSAHRLTLFASVYSLPRSSYFEQAKLLGAYGSPCSHLLFSSLRRLSVYLISAVG